MAQHWRSLADHARKHNATISSTDAAVLGIPSSLLAAWCEQGRLEHPSPQAYVVAGSPDTWHRRLSVAAISTEGWASHRSAAALWQLDGFSRRQVEVVTAHGRWRTRKDWIVHETRRFRGVDLAEVDGVPCTSVPRTILDLAAVEHPFRVAQALDHACRQWPGMLDLIVARFLELAGRGRNGTTLMRGMLDERIGRGSFTQSTFESRAVRLVRMAGLPEPALQHHVVDGDFSAYLDLAWPPIRWAIECDSLAHHSGKRAHEWDRLRRRRLKQLGWDLVEITYDDVAKRPDATGAEVRALYTARRKTQLPALSSRS